MYKYRYTGTGTITFYRDGVAYTVSAENINLPREIEFEVELKNPERFGLELVDEPKIERKTKIRSE